jgi:UDP-N-acetylmuramyl pentapeptide phosphotransferase/UDP-N-acetylglucosamine-1-phosphate transferase
MFVSQLFKIGVASAIVSFAMCTLILYSQKWHGRLSHDHDFSGVQKVHTTAVPRIGGLAIIAAIFLVLCSFDFVYPGELTASRVDHILVLLSAALPAFVAGIAEDLTKKVSVRVRLAATFCSALIASALLGATVNKLDIWGLDNLLAWGPVAIVVTAIVVAGAANAINIIDGFNGLSGTLIVIMSAALGSVAWQVGDTFVAILSAFGVGAAAGFLLLNYPSGKLFLGDGGAYFLGFWVAETAVLLLVRNPVVNAWQVLSICAYPVIEVGFSIYRRRIIQNVNAGAPDALHLHTLIYRRIAVRLAARHPTLIRLQNALVTCIVAPWVLAAAVASVLIGENLPLAVLLVFAQLTLYVAFYGRIVRGRWAWKKTSRPMSQHIPSRIEYEL